MSVNRYECGMTNAPTEYQSPTMHQDANGGYVSYDDYAALEAKCAVLTAENSGLNKFIKADCWVWDDKAEEYIDAVDCMPETPATDAFLAEVLAQEVDELAELYLTLARHEANRSIAESWRESARFAKDHADQIRKGVQS